LVEGSVTLVQRLPRPSQLACFHKRLSAPSECADGLFQIASGEEMVRTSSSGVRAKAAFEDSSAAAVLLPRSVSLPRSPLETLAQHPVDEGPSTLAPVLGREFRQASLDQFVHEVHRCARAVFFADGTPFPPVHSVSQHRRKLKSGLV